MSLSGAICRGIFLGVGLNSSSSELDVTSELELVGARLTVAEGIVRLCCPCSVGALPVEHLACSHVVVGALATVLVFSGDRGVGLSFLT